MKFRLPILAALLLVFSFIAYHSKLFCHSSRELADRFTEGFHKKQSELEHLTSQFLLQAEGAGKVKLFVDNKHLLDRLYQEKGFSILIFKNNEMVFWTDNSVPLLNYLEISGLESSVVQIQNGWYSMVVKRKGNIMVAGLVQIKKIYPHQNQYLANAFHKDFSLPSEAWITLEPAEANYQVTGKDGGFLFGLGLPTGHYPMPIRAPIASIAFLLGILLFTLYLQHLFFRGGRKPLQSFLLLSLTLLALRAFLLVARIPTFIFGHSIFSPVHYASSVVSPSLGDLLLNSLLLFYLLYVFNTRVSLKQLWLENAGKRARNAILVAAFMLLFLFAAQIAFWFTGLVLHSNINYGLDNIFEMNALGFTGFFIAVVLLFSFYLFADKLVGLLLLLKIQVPDILKLAIFPFLLYLLLIYFKLPGHNLLFLLWPLPVMLILWRARVPGGKTYTFSSVLLVVLVFSIFTSYSFNLLSKEREEKSRVVLIEKLAQEKDPIAEFLFKGIGQRISEDTLVMGYLADGWEKMGLLEQHLLAEYFTGYWGRYDFQFTTCGLGDSIFVAAEGSNINCFEFFNRMIRLFGQSTNGSDFYFLNNASGRISYLAALPVELPEGEVYLFIEADSKFLPEGSGYPELLLDESEIIQAPEVYDYSFAKYHNGRLVSKSGSYAYNVSHFSYLREGQKLYFIYWERFSHLVYKPDAGTTIVLSKPSRMFVDNITGFSYIFAFFSLLFLLVLFFRRAPGTGFNFTNLDFRTRIQAILVGTVLFSIIFFGVWTMRYIQAQYHLKNNSLVAEKMNSVLIELEHKIGNEQSLEALPPIYLGNLLEKFSNVFFSDINLYTVEGNLLSSSQQDIFNLGLRGRKMNPVAYRKMAISQKTEFVQRESIGKLEYISAYMPLYNVDGNLLAYLNLPYFAKQNELEREIASFLVALINIYVALFILSVIIAVFLSNLITGPLQLIRQKLRDVKLGKSNELIEWKGKDEIGSLVAEYNRMIAELAESAERLAKSEREMAWREMAKQVAHEIKNPLTPMKLSIQHLERAKKDNVPDFDKRLARFTQTLIEQIDALANIANEFSSFAKMPVSKPELIQVRDFVNKVAHLYKDTEKAEVKADCRFKGEVHVWADREQLLRVFHNLVRNALQSIPEEAPGLVEIIVGLEGKHVQFKVKDNGAGIPEGQKPKIFTPNFTTKSGGSGLGLSIVRNIVEGSGGGISFISEENKGTEFNFYLPVAPK